MIFNKLIKKIATGLLLSFGMYALLSLICVDTNKEQRLYINANIEDSSFADYNPKTYAILHKDLQTANNQCVGGVSSYSIPGINNSYNTDGMVSNVYETLFRYEPGKSYQPVLATRYYISPDRDVYTFDIRHNVKFHANSFFTPTRYLNADDVVFSVNMIKSILSNLSHNLKYDNDKIQSVYDNIRYVYALNDHQVQFVLHNPTPNFLKNLSNPAIFAVLSQEYYEYMKKHGRLENVYKNPVGTGVWVQYNKDQSNYTYIANFQYWGSNKAPIDKIEIRTEQEPETDKIWTMMPECNDNVNNKLTSLYHYRHRHNIDYHNISTLIWYKYIKYYVMPKYDVLESTTAYVPSKYTLVQYKPYKENLSTFDTSDNLILYNKNIKKNTFLYRSREVVVRRDV